MGKLRAYWQDLLFPIYSTAVINRCAVTGKSPLYSIFTLFLAVFPALASAQTAGEDDFFTAHKDYVDLVLFDPSNLYAQYLWEPTHDVDKAPDEANLHYAYVELDGGLNFSRDTFFFADFEYTYKRYGFEKNEGDAPSLGTPDFHQFESLMALTHFFTEDFLGLWAFRTGIDSDLTHDIGAKDLEWVSGPLVSYRFSPRFEGHIGVMTSSNYWDTSVFPIGGISWFSEDRRVHLNITAPFMFRAGYRPHGESEYFAQVWYHNADVRVFLGPDMVDSHVFTRDVQGGIGVLLPLAGQWTLTLEGGLTFTDTFNVKDGLNPGPGKDAEVAPYLSTAVGLLLE